MTWVWLKADEIEAIKYAAGRTGAGRTEVGDRSSPLAPH